MHDWVTKRWTFCPLPPAPAGTVQGLPSKQFGAVNHCERGYGAAETSGCFGSGWTTMNSVIPARKPTPRTILPALGGSRAVAGEIPTWGAAEEAKPLLDRWVTPWGAHSSSQVLRCLPHTPPASLLSPGHSSERDLCTAAASPGTQGLCWLVGDWGFFSSFWKCLLLR